MRTKKGQFESSVIQRLIDEPHRFEFFQAIRLILSFLRAHDMPFERVFGQVLRFENSTLLNFPASQIESLHGGADVDARTDRMLLLAIDDEANLRIRITPAFIGFLGTCGVLPYHYTERIVAHRQEERDASARAFIDVFSNRLVGQFYQAWEKYRLEHSLMTRGQDRQLPIMLALAGVRAGTDSFVGEGCAGGPSEHAMAFYAALFRMRPASGYAIARALTEYFGIPINLEESVGSWGALPPKMHSRLGGANPRLGFGAALGTRVLHHDRRVRLNIGPLDSKDLERFLPRSPGALALGRMLAMFDVRRIEVEVRLLLKPECIRPFTLTTRDRPSMVRLGWTTFLTTGTKPVDRSEVRYMLDLE